MGDVYAEYALHIFSFHRVNKVQITMDIYTHGLRQRHNQSSITKTPL